MSIVKQLKLSAESRFSNIESDEQRLRRRLVEQLDEQSELIQSDLAGQTLNKLRTVYTTNENGERVAQKLPRRMRRWYWHNSSGTWFMELCYGNRPLNILPDKSAIEVGKREDIPKVLEKLKEAVRAGELDKPLEQARKERAITMRKG
jgi:hypothetical protein